MSDYFIFIIIFLILGVIGFLNFRSNALAEEVRKKHIIEELPLTKQDVSRLFSKKQSSRSKYRNSYHHRGGGIDFASFDEVSPLKIMGYTVGAKGLGLDERTKVLNYALFGDFQRYMPEGIQYDYRWGEPGSRKRFGAVFNHIRRVKDLRNNRSGMELARRDWNADLHYIRTQQGLIYRFRLY